MSATSRFAGSIAAFACALAASAGCGDSGAAGAPSGAASVSGSAVASQSASAAPGPAWLGIPKTQEEVEKETNKAKREPYSGPVGTLKGVVKIKGDPAPDVEWAYGTECAAAASTYGKLFNVSANGGLADALVTVTGYDAYVPPKDPVVPVKVSQCAFDQRVYSLMFGQRLEVSNVDSVLSYTPYLDGAVYRSVMVALPNGSPIKVLPTQPALNYVLRDFQGRPFTQARVYALKFGTHDVTNRAGEYVIDRIPVGKVTINIAPPGFIKTDEASQKGIEFDIKEGDNVLDLEVVFDAKVDTIEKLVGGALDRKAPPSGASASAGPSAGPSAGAKPSAAPAKPKPVQ